MEVIMMVSRLLDEGYQGRTVSCINYSAVKRRF